MNNQQTPELSIMQEVIENLVRKTEILEKELKAKNEALAAKEEQTQELIADFHKRFENVVTQSPKPDIRPIESVIKNGLTAIVHHIENWPKPLKREYRFSLFPEQTKSVEYVSAVMTRLIVGSFSPCLLTIG